MRLTLSALIVAAGLAGFGAAAQAGPVASPSQLGVTASDTVVPVQMRRERRMMRHRMMRHRMMRHRMARHRMMRRRMNRM